MNDKKENNHNIPEWAKGDPLMEWYAATVWGKKIFDDNRLFEIMSLQIFQAGLSWRTILVKWDAFHRAFNGWRIDEVVSFGQKEIGKLMNDTSIIRNRKKIESCVENARVIQDIQKEYGSFCTWFYKELEGNDLEPLQKTLRTTFKFVGPEIARMWLMASGRIDSDFE